MSQNAPKPGGPPTSPNSDRAAGEYDHQDWHPERIAEEKGVRLLLTRIFDLMEGVAWHNQGVTGGHLHPLVPNESGDGSRQLHDDLFMFVIVQGKSRSWFLTLADNRDLGCSPTRSGEATSEHSREPTRCDVYIPNKHPRNLLRVNEAQTCALLVESLPESLSSLQGPVGNDSGHYPTDSTHPLWSS